MFILTHVVCISYYATVNIFSQLNFLLYVTYLMLTNYQFSCCLRRQFLYTVYSLYLTLGTFCPDFSQIFANPRFCPCIHIYVEKLLASPDGFIGFWNNETSETKIDEKSFTGVKRIVGMNWIVETKNKTVKT